MFLQVLSKTGVLILLLLIGGFARYKKVLDKDSTRALSRVVLVVTLPFLYFYSLATGLTAELARTIWILPVSAVLLVLISCGIANIFSRFISLNAPQKATFIYLATFTNCGFLALPIANALYGAQGVVRVVFFNFGFSFLLWTLGVMILRRGSETLPSKKPGITAVSRNLINSGVIGLMAGVVVGMAALKTPVFVLDSAKILGSATIPLALLVVGSMMSKVEVDKLRAYRHPLILLILCRLIIIPAGALLITGLIGPLPPLVRAVIVLQSSMPSASTTPIFTARFGGDPHLASAAVFATTACSVITIPMFISLV